MAPTPVTKHITTLNCNPTGSFASGRKARAIARAFTELEVHFGSGAPPTALKSPWWSHTHRPRRGKKAPGPGPCAFPDALTYSALHLGAATQPNGAQSISQCITAHVGWQPTAGPWCWLLNTTNYITASTVTSTVTSTNME